MSEHTVQRALANAITVNTRTEEELAVVVAKILSHQDFIGFTSNVLSLMPRQLFNGIISRTKQSAKKTAISTPRALSPTPVVKC